MTLEDLMVEHKNATTHRERAKVEQLVWSLAPLGVHKRDWACKTLGIGCFDIEIHRLFFRFGAWAEPLWPMLDAGLSLKAARRVINAAYKLSKASGLSPGEATKQALANECKSKDKPKEKPQKNRSKVADNNQASKEFHAALESLILKYSTEFHADLENLILKYSDRASKDVEEHVFKQLADELVGMAEGAFEDFTNGMVNARKRASRLEAPTNISRVRFKQACDVLCLSYSYGSKIPMREVQKAKNKRVLELHPDRQQEVNPLYNEELTRVAEAYKTLDAYNRQG